MFTACLALLINVFPLAYLQKVFRQIYILSTTIKSIPLNAWEETYLKLPNFYILEVIESTVKEPIRFKKQFSKTLFIFFFY